MQSTYEGVRSQVEQKELEKKSFKMGYGQRVQENLLMVRSG